jgi:pyruvate dehydrogenase phosphatase
VKSRMSSGVVEFSADLSLVEPLVMPDTNGLAPCRRRKPPTLLSTLRLNLACKSLGKVFLVGNDIHMRPPPPNLKTPPYIIARPVVTHRKLTIPPIADPNAPSSNSTFRFIVLATDGLWDQLTSEDVVSLVGGHLSGVKGIVPKSVLPSVVPTTAGSRTVEGKNRRQGKREGSWAFVDDNVSTHLIRNAFGGGDEIQLRKLLSIPVPHSRRFRDDVTVTVLWWEEGQDGTNLATFAPRQMAQAKL